MRNGTRALRIVSGWVVSLGAVGLTLWIVSQRFPVSLSRYFDMDEYAYLSWSHQLLSGQKLYSDIFYHIGLPGFLWLLFPIHIFIHGNVAVLEAARLLSFFLYCALACASGLLFWVVRRHWTSLLVPLFLLFLPLPSDKFMEIRPDTAGLLFLIFGMICQTLFMKNSKGKLFVWISIGAGLCYGLSISIISKMLPFIGIASFIVVGWAIDYGKGNGKRTASLLIPFFTGMGVVGVIMGAWFICSTDLWFSWYNIVKAPFEVYQFLRIYSPWKYEFFFPNDVYFGTTGRHIGYMLTLGMWGTAIITATSRLLFSLGVTLFKRKILWQEFLPALMFFWSIVSYLFVIDMHHGQYLMPMAVFVAWYCGDLIYLGFSILKRHCIGICIFFIMMAVLGKSIVTALPFEILPKRYWWNAGARKLVETIEKTIPADEPVFDLVGIAFTHPAPYPLSNVPVGQFQPYLTRPLPSVKDTLTATDTKYIIQGGTGRISVLQPEDLAWVKEQYTPVLNEAVYVRNDVLPSYQESLRLLSF